MRLLILAPIMMLVGCGGPSGGPVAFEDLDTELADVACNTLVECGTTFTLPAQWAGDGCTRTISGLYRNSFLPGIEDAIDRGTIRYDADAAAQCLANYDALGCDAATAISNPAYVETCSAMFVGQVADGGACQMDEECVETSYCGGAACPGVCEPRTAAGEACTDPSSCQLGYYCREGTCRTLTDSGGTCTVEAPYVCSYNQVCIGATAGTPGQCTSVSELQTQAEGETCSPVVQNGMLCRSGLSCAVVDTMGTYECRAAVGAGASCFLAIPDMCPDGQYCYLETGTTAEGVCVDLPTEGESCSGVIGCAAGLTCATNVCVVVNDNGASCTQNSECYSSRCEGGACVAPEICIAP